MKEQLEALTKEWKANPIDVAKLPAKVPVEALKTLPDLYQPRADVDHNGVTDSRHADKLALHLRDPEADLDPITVLHVNGQNIVIDGHHRLKAYKKIKTKNVPVRYYPKSPVEALVEAGRDNVKDRLQMSPAEKSQRAWDLVRSGVELTGKQIQQASGRSKRTVAHMRQKLKEYQRGGKDVPESWAEAWRGDEERGDWERENVAAQVAEWAERLRLTFPPLDSNGAAYMFARAIAECWPKRADDIARALVEGLGLDEEIREALERDEDDPELEF